MHQFMFDFTAKPRSDLIRETMYVCACVAVVVAGGNNQKNACLVAPAKVFEAITGLGRRKKHL